MKLSERLRIAADEHLWDGQTPIMESRAYSEFTCIALCKAGMTYDESQTLQGEFDVPHVGGFQEFVYEPECQAVRHAWLYQLATYYEEQGQ